MALLIWHSFLAAVPFFLLGAARRQPDGRSLYWWGAAALYATFIASLPSGLYVANTTGVVMRMTPLAAFALGVVLPPSWTRAAMALTTGTIVAAISVVAWNSGPAIVGSPLRVTYSTWLAFITVNSTPSWMSSTAVSVPSAGAPLVLIEMLGTFAIAAAAVAAINYWSKQELRTVSDSALMGALGVILLILPMQPATFLAMLICLVVGHLLYVGGGAPDFLIAFLSTRRGRLISIAVFIAFVHFAFAEEMFQHFGFGGSRSWFRLYGYSAIAGIWLGMAVSASGVVLRSEAFAGQLLIFVAVMGIVSVAFGMFSSRELVPTTFVSDTLLLLTIVGFLGMPVGIGLRAGKRWARRMAVAISVVALVLPPIGTAIGCYLLWVLAGVQRVRERTVRELPELASSN